MNIGISVKHCHLQYKRDILPSYVVGAFAKAAILFYDHTTTSPTMHLEVDKRKCPDETDTMDTHTQVEDGPWPNGLCVGGQWIGFWINFEQNK